MRSVSNWFMLNRIAQSIPIAVAYRSERPTCCFNKSQNKSRCTVSSVVSDQCFSHRNGSQETKFIHCKIIEYVLNSSDVVTSSFFYMSGEIFKVNRPKKIGWRTSSLKLSVDSDIRKDSAFSIYFPLF